MQQFIASGQASNIYQFFYEICLSYNCKMVKTMTRFGIMSVPQCIQGNNIFLILGDSNKFQNMLLQRKVGSKHGEKIKKFDMVLLARENLTSLQRECSVLAEELSHVSTDETGPPDTQENQLVAQAKDDRYDTRSSQCIRRRIRHSRLHCVNW